MFEREWAAIVYGRSYHLDFRFITVPHNFGSADIQWAASYIVATTQQARNLAGSPRWSLFKNDTYCVVGVTCMVRDLIAPTERDLSSITKDDQGRPLYVFVGYVTELTQHHSLEQFPVYRGNSLDDFQALYQAIEQVWLVKNFEQQQRKTFLSQYQTFCFEETTKELLDQQVPTLNHQLKAPKQTHLWSSTKQQNSLLWLASARCPEATSSCLNISGKVLSNSPFLNQSCTQIQQFQVKQRIRATPNSSHNLSLPPNSKHHASGSSLSQKISDRAKEDLDLTLHQAAKLATASQELLNNFTDWSKQEQTVVPPDVPPSASDSLDEAESFGFKRKKSSSANNQDWF